MVQNTVLEKSIFSLAFSSLCCFFLENLKLLLLAFNTLHNEKGDGYTSSLNIFMIMNKNLDNTFLLQFLYLFIFTLKIEVQPGLKEFDYRRMIVTRAKILEVEQLKEKRVFK